MALPKPTPPTSDSERLKGNIISAIIAFFLFYIFYAFLDFLFKPLRVLSPKEAAKRVEEKIMEKRVKRWERELNDPNDPMVQFNLRFVEDLQAYKNDSDNETYFAWFQEWKDGNIIDSDLRWAPEALDSDFNLRPNFIHYMKIQLALHKKTSLIRKMQFTNTIFKYYPELSTSLRGLEEDLAQYDAEIEEKEASEILEKEIGAFGLPKEVANYLARKDINAETLRKEAIFLKECLENCGSTEACILALENNIPAVAPALEILRRITEDFGLFDEAAVAFAKGELTDINVVAMCKEIEEYQEQFGKPNKKFKKNLLSKYRGKELIKKINRKG